MKMTLKQRAIIAAKSAAFWAISGILVEGLAACNIQAGEWWGDLVSHCIFAPFAEETFKAAYAAFGSPLGGVVLGWFEFVGYVINKGISPDVRLPMLAFHSAMGFLYYAVANGMNLAELSNSMRFKVTVLLGMVTHALSNYRYHVDKFHWVRAGHFSAYVGSWAGWLAEMALWVTIGAVSYYFVRKIQKGGKKKAGE